MAETIGARRKSYEHWRTAMSIGEKINADIIPAMKAKQEHRLTTLRMVKSALKSKEIDKRAPLSEAEEVGVRGRLSRRMAK